MLLLVLDPVKAVSVVALAPRYVAHLTAVCEVVWHQEVASLGSALLESIVLLTWLAGDLR